jgi:hypothetical protein
MEYLLMIYYNENEWRKKSEAELAKISSNYMDFTRGIMTSGHYKGGNRLDYVTNATTVRVREGKRTVTDGPFAETKEQLGGYYLIEAKDIDEVLSIAARIPGASYGSIEVRPIIPVNIPQLA